MSKHYRWNWRKCARNLGGILLRTIIVICFILYAGFNPMRIF